ncbi:MAG: hypothetical protein JKY15_07045 [Deltaproteobacteria bacterium]|nr:hypothetical protein [Deltaproteobacteria bacterium]
MILACPSKKAEPEISPSFDKSTSTLTVQVKLPAGKHAYAPGEPIGQPIALRIEPDNNWVLATPIELPKGDSKHLLNDNFKIKAKVKNGRGPISAILHMQLCTAEACERPKDYAFQVSL